MLRTIRAKLLAMILILGLFILGSFSLSYHFVREHQYDEELINLVRTNVQILNELSQVAIQLHISADPDRIQQFENTLLLLDNGGEVTTDDGQSIRITGVPAASPIVSDVREHWDSYIMALDSVSTTYPGLPEHDRLETELLYHANEINRSLFSIWGILEEGSDIKHSRLVLLNLLILALAFPVLGFSMLLVNRRITGPLKQLTETALNFRGSGAVQIHSSRPDEIDYLGHAFEKMRIEIQEHDELLEKKIDNRVREIAAAYEISQDIVRQLELDDLLDAAKHKVKSLLNADVVSICLMDLNNRNVTRVATTTDIPLINKQVSPEQAVVRIATRQGHETLVEQVLPGECELLKYFNGSRCFATPLVLGDKILGEICVVRNEVLPLNENEKRALMLLANAIAVAVQNARLSDQIKMQASEKAMLTERERVASELHDHLAQTLSALNLQTDELEGTLPDGLKPEIPNQVRGIRSNLNTALEQIRIAISGYNAPPIQDAEKFYLELKDFVAGFEEDSGIAVSFQDPDQVFTRFEPIVQKQILYIVREALTNTSKHAGAGAAEISLSVRDSYGEILIRDDGAGFDLHERRGDHHLGLQIMRARAERTGGEIQVVSSPGRGTTITARFPLRIQESIEMDQA